nr:hypothetical protein [uncultured Rhodopila sp.]
MFSLFAFQIALTRLWLRVFGGPEAFQPVGHGLSRSESKVASDAALELERIVLAHAVRRERMN